MGILFFKDKKLSQFLQPIVLNYFIIFLKTRRCRYIYIPTTVALLKTTKWWLFLFWHRFCTARKMCSTMSQLVWEEFLKSPPKQYKNIQIHIVIMYSKNGKNTGLVYGIRSTLYQSKTFETYQNCTFLWTLDHYKELKSFNYSPTKNI